MQFQLGAGAEGSHLRPTWVTFSAACTTQKDFLKTKPITITKTTNPAFDLFFLDCQKGLICLSDFEGLRRSRVFWGQKDISFLLTLFFPLPLCSTSVSSALTNFSTASSFVLYELFLPLCFLLSPFPAPFSLVSFLLKMFLG